MLRAWVVAFAVVAAVGAICSAQTIPPTTATSDQSRRILNSNNVSTHPTPKQRPFPTLNSSAGATFEEDSGAENELLQAANQSRERAGGPPLRVDESLREAARAHALRMIASDRLEHRLPGESSLLERIAKANSQDDAPKIDRAGENIAHASCAAGANDVLMRSAPHRQNLLDRKFNIAGIAAFWSKGKLYVVEDFAHDVPSYSAQQSGNLVRQAVAEERQQAGLTPLEEFRPPDLDQAACKLAVENRPNARLLATAYDNRKILTYTQSRPEILPPNAQRMLRDPGVRQFAVGSCYARNVAYPTGMYWVAILLY